MQQKWWLVAAGVVGLALAILLFPKPDQSNLPDPDLARTNPTNFKAKGADGAAGKSHRKVRVGTREMRSEDVLRQDIARMAGKEFLAEPESIYSGRLSGPWTLIRRQMLANGNEAAKAWAEQLTPLVMDLRARRRDPKGANWDELRSRQDALLVELRAQPDWVAIEGVDGQIDRIDEIFTTFDAEKAAAATEAGEVEEAPSQGN